MRSPAAARSSSSGRRRRAASTPRGLAELGWGVFKRLRDSVLRVSVYPRQRSDPLLYRPCALSLICRLLAVGSISTPVVT